MIPPRSKPEVVGWFLEAAKEYGRQSRPLAVTPSPQATMAVSCVVIYLSNCAHAN